MAHITFTAPFSVDDEAALIRQARDDPAAFAPIYEQYANRIYGYCLRQVGNTPEAEDLTSQIFTAALLALSTYRGGSAQAWLFRIAHNQVVTYFRQQTRQRRFVKSETQQQSVLASHTTAADYALANLISVEQQAYVHALVENLPTEQRELLALRVDVGLSAKEIGQIVGKREAAVRMALHRIFQKLRLDVLDKDSR